MLVSAARRPLSGNDGCPMNSRPPETVVPPTDRAAAATVSARRSMLGAILTDVHFWVPVVVLGLGLSLLVYIS